LSPVAKFSSTAARSTSRKRLLWRLSVLTRPAAEEAVIELLGNASGLPVSSSTNLETQETTASVWFEERPAWSGRLQEFLLDGLAQIKKCGLNPGPAEISLAKVPREQWAESWKRHFPPLEIGSELLIRPSWNRRRVRKGQRVVVLNPGLSFGTGQHPTTRFCLQQLAARRRRPRAQSFLDLGTGSGILAIAAGKLGYAPIEAIEFDPEALSIARANARRNRVSGRIRFLERDVTKLPRLAERKFDVICANLISSLLESEMGRILARLAANGRLVLAGILQKEFPAIQKAYETAGMKLLASRTQGEWESGSFVWRGNPLR